MKPLREGAQMPIDALLLGVQPLLSKDNILPDDLLGAQCLALCAAQKRPDIVGNLLEIILVTPISELDQARWLSRSQYIVLKRLAIEYERLLKRFVIDIFHHSKSDEASENMLQKLVVLVLTGNILNSTTQRNLVEQARDKVNGRKSRASPPPKTKALRQKIKEKVESLLADKPDLTHEEVWDRVWADGAIRKLGVRNTVRSAFNIAIQKFVNEPPH